jgi:hypothetical protein
MSAKIVNRKKSYTALITIGVIGGISVVAFLLAKKHKIKINSINENKEGDNILSKTYIISVGLRYVEINSKPNERDTFVLNEPIFIYTFNTIEEKDKNGIPKVEVTIKNRFTKKEEKIILEDALPN